MSATGALIALAVAMAGSLVEDAAAQAQGQPSDPDRAELYPGNPQTCANIGLPGARQLVNGDDGGSAESEFVRGTVERNPDFPTGDLKRVLQVAITQAGQGRVVIRAVAVKGGPYANIYRAPFVPPDLAPPQNYRPPLNHGGQQADISNWFICYTVEDPPGPGSGTGTLSVFKQVDRPAGEPVDPLPDEYRVRVRCTQPSGAVKVRVFRFGAGGGDGTTVRTDRPYITLERGARCRIRELTELPRGCQVSYVPAWAGDPGVEIGEGHRVVTVVNDCENAEVQTGSVEIVKRIEGFAPGELPDSFVFDVECSDGTDERVRVPATGMPGRVDGIRVGEYCLVTERTASLPPDLQVTFTIDGEPSPVPGAAELRVTRNRQVVAVTATNSLSTTAPVQPPEDVPGRPPPQLDPDKTVRPGFVRAGGRVRFSIEVRNFGLGVGRNVLVCDRLPAAMTLVSAPGSRFREGRICWRIGRLRPFASRRFTLIARAGARASGTPANVTTADAPRTRARTARVRVLVGAQRGPRPGAVTG